MRTLSKAEAVIHPVRLRITSALSGGPLATKQIARMLPDVPPASLYRHVKTLLDSEIIEVVKQHTVNGIVESIYAVRKNSTHFDRKEFAEISPEDHQRFYASFVSTLVSTIGRYFDQEAPDTTRDGMTYFIANLHLTDEERRDLRVELLELCRRYDKTPGEGARLTQLGVSLSPELFLSPETI